MRYLTIGSNWGSIVLIGWFSIEHSAQWLPLINTNPELFTGGLFALLSSLLFSVNRRVKSDKAASEFFSESELMNLPKNKTRYSDRMAYILAEMSDLAYFEVEKEEDNLVQFATMAKQTVPESGKAIDKLIMLYKKQLRTQTTNGAVIANERDLNTLLQKHNFKFHPPYLNTGSAQGFIGEYIGSGSPFIIVAFRGTEKKVEDWLTNANATPSNKVKNGKVHSGFYDDFNGVRPKIIEKIKQIKEAHGNSDVPVFFTGHSLGGALATIATRELLPDGIGACYSYGAPRVGDYEYFNFVKTPIYRVVNSSDIVPRVPPGVWTTVFLKLLSLIRYLLVRFEWTSNLISAAEGWVNSLKDYRHFGDLRYLTDVNSKRFDKVMLLRNPHYLDILQWLWRHIFISLGLPVRNHGMNIYRKKLTEVGLNRIKRKRAPKTFNYFQ